MESSAAMVLDRRRIRYSAAPETESALHRQRIGVLPRCHICRTSSQPARFRPGSYSTAASWVPAVGAATTAGFRSAYVRAAASSFQTGPLVETPILSIDTGQSREGQKAHPRG